MMAVQNFIVRLPGPAPDAPQFVARLRCLQEGIGSSCAPAINPTVPPGDPSLDSNNTTTIATGKDIERAKVVCRHTDAAGKRYEAAFPSGRL